MGAACLGGGASGWGAAHKNKNYYAFDPWKINVWYNKIAQLWYNQLIIKEYLPGRSGTPSSSSSSTSLSDNCSVNWSSLQKKIDNMDIFNRLVYRVRGGTEKRPQRKIASENKQIILRIRNSKNAIRPWPQQRVARHASFRQGFNCLALKVIKRHFWRKQQAFYFRYELKSIFL